MPVGGTISNSMNASYKGEPSVRTETASTLESLLCRPGYRGVNTVLYLQAASAGCFEKRNRNWKIRGSACPPYGRCAIVLEEFGGSSVVHPATHIPSPAG